MNLQAIIARRKAIAERLAALAGIVETESRTLTTEEVNEITTLEGEDAALNETQGVLERQAARVAAQAAAQAEPARPRGVAPVAIPAAPTVLRTTREQRNGDAFPGQSFARLQLARLRAGLALKRGEVLNVAGLMASLYPNRPELAQLAAAHTRRLAAGVEGGAILSGEAGAELRALDAEYTGDFIEYLHGKTLFDQMGFRRVPADVRIKGQDGAFGGGFVGEKRPIPVSIGSYSSVDLSRLKAAGLTYLSRDLIERSAPAAEMLFRDGLVKALSKAVDTLAFSATAASNNIAPAGLLNGITGQASAGGSLENLYTDLAYLTGVLVAGLNADGDLKYVSNRTLANQIAHLLSPLDGQPAFRGQVTMNGGVLNGLPYVTGDNVASGNLLLIKPSDVWVIDDSGISVALSEDATIEADDSPTGEGVTPTAQSASMVSMFQTDMVAIKAIRDVNWQYRRTSTIVTARVHTASYDGVAATA